MIYKKIQSLTNNFSIVFSQTHSRIQIFVIPFLFQCNFIVIVSALVAFFVLVDITIVLGAGARFTSAVQLVPKMPGCAIFAKSLGIGHSASSQFLLSASCVSLVSRVFANSSCCYQLYSFLVKKRGFEIMNKTGIYTDSGTHAHKTHTHTHTQKQTNTHILRLKERQKQ